MTFNIEDKNQIQLAIAAAELQTSGEIRVCIEDTCSVDVLDRAAFQFQELGMHKTELRNGVLIYICKEKREFAIIGDAGINAVAGEGFWDRAKETMLQHFKAGKFAEGLCVGIALAGAALQQHFPRSADDINELPNDIIEG